MDFTFHLTLLATAQNFTSFLGIAHLLNLVTAYQPILSFKLLFRQSDL